MILFFVIAGMSFLAWEIGTTIGVFLKAKETERSWIFQEEYQRNINFLRQKVDQFIEDDLDDLEVSFRELEATVARRKATEDRRKKLDSLPEGHVLFGGVVVYEHVCMGDF